MFHDSSDETSVMNPSPQGHVQNGNSITSIKQRILVHKHWLVKYFHHSSYRQHSFHGLRVECDNFQGFQNIRRENPFDRFVSTRTSVGIMTKTLRYRP